MMKEVHGKADQAAALRTQEKANKLAAERAEKLAAEAAEQAQKQAAERVSWKAGCWTG